MLPDEKRHHIQYILENRISALDIRYSLNISICFSYKKDRISKYNRGLEE